MDAPRLARTSWALALYAYSDDAPPPALFAEFFDRMERLMEDWGVSPAHAHVAGKGYRESFRKGQPWTYNEHPGRTAKRLKETSFAGVTGVGLAATRPGTDSEGKHSYVIADLEWAEDLPGELRLVLTVNEAISAFDDPGFRALLLELLAWRRWSFGHALRDSLRREPFDFIRGFALRQRFRDYRANEVWEEARAAARQRVARGVFPVLVLNDRQLRNSTLPRDPHGDLWSESTQDAADLDAFIARAKGTYSERVGDLLVWWIPSRRLGSIRRRLRGTEALMPPKLPRGYFDRDVKVKPPASSVPGSALAAEPSPLRDAGPNPARDALWELIRARVAQAPEVVPVVPFDAYFEGNDEEDSIAPNQLGFGRPTLTEMHAQLKVVAARPDVQAVLVSLNDDALDWLKEGETDHWPEAESLHIITSAPEDEVKRWVEDFACDDVYEHPKYSAHPAAPDPRPGYRAFTLFWD